MLRELLLQARVESGLSVRDLANLVAERRGRSAESVRTTIHRYEAEGGPEPRIQTVEDVLGALGLELKLSPLPPKKSSKRG